MIFGITYILFLISSFNSASLFSRVSISSPISFTLAFTCSASSFFPSRINKPISLDILLRSARKASPFAFTALTSLSNSATSSTIGSFSSWNFFLIFSFTSSGFSRINLMSIIFILLYKIKNIIHKGTMFVIAVPPFLLIDCFT